MLELHILAVERLVVREKVGVGKTVDQLSLEKALGEGERLILGVDVENMRGQFFEELQIGW